jgi:hypothetical protein
MDGLFPPDTDLGIAASSMAVAPIRSVRAGRLPAPQLQQRSAAPDNHRCADRYSDQRSADPAARSEPASPGTTGSGVHALRNQRSAPAHATDVSANWSGCRAPGRAAGAACGPDATPIPRLTRWCRSDPASLRWLRRHPLQRWRRRLRCWDMMGSGARLPASGLFPSTRSPNRRRRRGRTTLPEAGRSGRSAG